jgi:glutaredoxin
MTITLYTRQGCHLCEQAQAVIAEVAAGRATVEIVDIDTDEALRDRYTVRVPVVAVDGVEIAEYEVSRDLLLDVLRSSDG